MAILTSLTVVCALVPLIDSVTRRLAQRHPDGTGPARPEVPPLGRRLAAAARRPAVAAAVIIALAAPIDAAALAGNKQVILIERGQIGKRNAQ